MFIQRSVVLTIITKELLIITDHTRCKVYNNIVDIFVFQSTHYKISF